MPSEAFFPLAQGVNLGDNSLSRFGVRMQQPGIHKCLVGKEDIQSSPAPGLWMGVVWFQFHNQTHCPFYTNTGPEAQPKVLFVTL